MRLNLNENGSGHNEVYGNSKTRIDCGFASYYDALNLSLLPENEGLNFNDGRT
jgi:hypothetical protein